MPFFDDVRDADFRVKRESDPPLGPTYLDLRTTYRDPAIPYRGAPISEPAKALAEPEPTQ